VAIRARQQIPPSAILFDLAGTGLPRCTVTVLITSILVKNLDSDPGVQTLTIGEWRFERIDQIWGRQLLARAQTLFPGFDVQFSDWVLERSDETPPPSRTARDPGGVGDIPFLAEDLLLALRLLRPGDISFAAQTYEERDEPLRHQQEYRYFSAIDSVNPYHFQQADEPEVRRILAMLRMSQASSPWFAVARRFFLYGGAKEFNPTQYEIDRIIDYCIALEAVLTFENDFVSRLVRLRGPALLGRSNAGQRAETSLLKTFYGHRSTMVHGGTVEISNPHAFHDDMQRFETIVRDVLRAALAQIPADDDARRSFLVGLYSIGDSDRLERIRQMAASIQDVPVRDGFLEASGRWTS
jgi:hypothetical protein